jgi:hypothetical protein
MHHNKHNAACAATVTKRVDIRAYEKICSAPEQQPAG